MKPDRQEVLAGGVAVLSAVFDSLDIEEMRPARGALRVGVLYDLLGRRERKDLRDSSVVRMQARFGVDRAQAQRVATLAAQFCSALNVATSDETTHRLRWAALLHEVGFAISHNDYHKHAAYLVRHSDIAGFSASDQERVATLVLAQRGNLKKVQVGAGRPRSRCNDLVVAIGCHRRARTTGSRATGLVVKIRKNNRARPSERLDDATSADSILIGRGSDALGARGCHVCIETTVAPMYCG